MSNPQLAAAIARLRTKGNEFGEALAAEQTLEDNRSLLKEMAIRRIMDRDKCSATTAKDIVRSDLEYMNHRIAQRESVVAHYRAEAEYWAAKAEVTQASLITPDVFNLEAENAKFSRMVDDLDAQLLDVRKRLVGVMRERDDATTGLREATRQNKNLVQTTEELVNANHELSGQLAVANEMIEALKEQMSDMVEVSERE